MSVLNYAVADNLPPPVTVAVPSAGGGTGIQSFTDVTTGEIWVAKAGVYNGNWIRARDVLYGVVYRAGAYTTATGLGLYGWDTVSSDLYGMWAGNPTYGFICPIAGMYRLSTQVGMSMNAASEYQVVALFAGASAGTQITADYGFGGALTTGNLFARSTATSYDFVGDQLSVKIASSVAAASGLTGAVNTHFAVEFMGPG